MYIANLECIPLECIGIGILHTISIFSTIRFLTIIFQPRAILPRYIHVYGVPYLVGFNVQRTV